MTICRASAPPRRGDSEAGKFPHRFVLLESSHCESLSQKSKIFASSLWQGSLWGAATKPPLSKGGASACRGGGIPQAKPGNFLPITYSLFTKKLSLFHIGLYFEEVPTVNPSVTPPACQLPFAREPRAVPAANTHGNLQQIVTAPPMPGNVTGWKSRHRAKAPLAKGGCLGLPRRGDSPGEAWELLTDYLFTIH